MVATNTELEVRLERLELAYASLNTRNDIIALTDQQNDQHAALVARIQQLEANTAQLIAASITMQQQMADHETRIAALE